MKTRTQQVEIISNSTETTEDALNRAIELCTREGELCDSAKIVGGFAYGEWWEKQRGLVIECVFFV